MSISIPKDLCDPGTSVGNSIVYWIPHSTHHACHMTILNCRQSVSQSFIGAFSVPLTVKTDMISSFNQLPLGSVYYNTVQSYPFISIHFDIRIIGLIVATRKDSKIAITRSCHLVSVQSANIYAYATYTYPYQSYESLPTRYMQLRTLKIAWMASGIEFILPTQCSLWWKIYAVTFSLQFHFRSNQPLQVSVHTHYYEYSSQIAVYSITLQPLFRYVLVSFGAQLKRNYTPVYQYHTPDQYHASILRFEAKLLAKKNHNTHLENRIPYIFRRKNDVLWHEWLCMENGRIDCGDTINCAVEWRD